eukprot:1536817-Pleurochrysis_carterae.AAC.2
MARQSMPTAYATSGRVCVEQLHQRGQIVPGRGVRGMEGCRHAIRQIRLDEAVDVFALSELDASILDFDVDVQ